MEDKTDNKQEGILFSDAEIEIHPEEYKVAPAANGISTDADQQYDGPVFRPQQYRTNHQPKPYVNIGDRSLLVMSVVAIVVGFIALLIGGLGLSRRGDIFVNVSSGSDSTTDSSEVTSETTDDTVVWTFAIGNYDSRLEYIDETTGEVDGFNVDIVNAVCRIADKNCKFVWDLYDNCWSSVAGQASRGGVGLLGNWYDACTAWAVSYERSRTFAFTIGLSKQHLSVFMVKMGTPSDAFNWRDLTGETIGFLQSYVENVNCVKRHTEITGANLASSQIRYYNTQQELLSAVTNDEVHAVFVNEFLEVTAHLQIASNKLSKCSLSGQAIMTKKESKLPGWWDPAFKTLLESPEYGRICSGLEDETIHGTIPGPTASQHCIGF